MTQALVQPVSVRPLPDPDLLAQARQGSEAAYAEIIRRHNRRLFRIVRSVLKNDAEAEDALQDTYVQAFVNLATLRDDASLAGWLGRIAVNEALTRLRRRRATVTLDAVETAQAEEDSIVSELVQSAAALNPETAAAHGEIKTILAAAIDKLPTHFRTVFVACGIEQMSIEEAASCFGLPPNTIKTRFHRAKRLLRKALGEEFLAALPDVFPFAGARCDAITARVLARLALRRN
jgi:RNA polymerase sigma-70 factor, ECF subfamily